MKKKKNKRDIEKTYSKKEFIQKIRRLADSLEKDKSFSIQISGERVHVPKNSVVNIEHERSAKEEEIEFQIKWNNN